MIPAASSTSATDTGPARLPVRLDSEQTGRFNRRFGVALDDGARVEAVLYRGDTLCISCQVGCAVACPFCASGANGLARPLSLDEMIAQVRAVSARGHAVRRVTVSGVGEPLHNHANVWALLEWCRAERLGFSLTTSGGPVGRLQQWLHAPHKGLTLSVHAGTEPVRRRMVPKGPALGDLFEVLEAELPSLSGRRKRKLALAYLMVAGHTDRDEEIDAFVERVRGLDVDVHLYAYNPVASSHDAPVSRERYEHAYAVMTAAGLRVRMSSRARVEQNGGCGTLVALRPGSREASRT